MPEDFPEAQRRGKGRRSRRNRKFGDELFVFVDEEEPFLRVDIDLAVREGGVRRNEPFVQVLDLERQHVRHFHGVADLELLQVHARIQSS